MKTQISVSNSAEREPNKNNDTSRIKHTSTRDSQPTRSHQSGSSCKNPCTCYGAEIRDRKNRGSLMLDAIKNLIMSKMQTKPTKNQPQQKGKSKMPAKKAKGESMREEAREMKTLKAKPSSKATKMKAASSMMNKGYKKK